MKKITLLIACLGFVTVGMAQVQVKGDTFIYSKGTDIYITKGLLLENAPSATDKTGSAFYLRDEAQLIQGDPAAIASGDPIGNNGGAGTFSIFQQGAANNFTYNYWSSPVKLPGNPSTEGFRNSQIFFPTITDGFASGTDLVINSEHASIVSNLDGKTDIQIIDSAKETIVNRNLEISSRWLYSYNSFTPEGTNNGVSGYYGWKTFRHPINDVVFPGYGFIMKGVNEESGSEFVNFKESKIGSEFKSGQRYDFRGLPNNGDIYVGVATNDVSLVGNPYPSALDLKSFLVENRREIDGMVLFWESQPTSHNTRDYEGGYGSYIPGSLERVDNEYKFNGEYIQPIFVKYTNSGIPIDGSANDVNTPAPSGTVNEQRYAPIGQGFLIQRSKDDNVDTAGEEGPFLANTKGSALFKNSQRAFVNENPNTSIFKSAPTSGNDQTATVRKSYVLSKIRINAFVNSNFNREFYIAFDKNATNAWDWGQEASNSSNKAANDVFMPIEGKEAIFQTIPDVTDNTAVPISFVTASSAGTFKIKVLDFVNFDTENVFIHDKESNTYHDILNDSYTIETDKGEVKDRYEIVFQEKTTLSTGEVAVAEGYNIFQNNQQSLLTVRNANSQDIANISVFDLSGRLVTSSNPTDISVEYTFNTASYATGIYIVKVTTADDAEIATKVVVSN